MEHDNDALLEALDGALWLTEVLGALRGEPLDAGRRRLDAVDGLGALSVWLGAPERRAALERALGDAKPEVAVGRVLRRWTREPGGARLARLLAVLLRAWGLEADARGELVVARRWLEQSVGWMAMFLEDPDTLRAALPDGAPEHALSAIQEGLAGALFDTHAQRAREAIDARDWPRAKLHWRLLSANTALAPEAARAAREALVGRVVAVSHAFVEAGAARGAGLADARALDVVCEGLEVEPDSVALHRQVVMVGVRAAMLAYGLDMRARFDQHIALARPSLMWFRRHPPEPDAIELREVLAEGWVALCVGEPTPRVAVRHLREALHAYPDHPTARRLLGQALAAMAARLLGAERVEASEAALEEATAILPPSEALARLRRAVHSAKRDAGAPPEALGGDVFELDEALEPPAHDGWDAWMVEATPEAGRGADAEARDDTPADLDDDEPAP